MSRRAFRPRGEICQLCELITAPRFLARPSHQAPKAINITRTFSSHGRTYAQKNRAARSSQSPAKESSVSTQSPGAPKITPMHGSDAQLVEGVEGAKKACDIILSLKGAPSELIVLRALDICGKVAGNLVEEPTRPVVENTDGTATSALLSLVNSSTKEVRPQKITPDLRKSIDELSDLVYSVVKHPPVFITPEILKAYVEVQSCLGKPETFPEVLDLYANKPAPVEGTSPVRYTKQNPNKVANAVPADVANRALQTAIDARQLGVTIDIIETTYTTKAFHRAKLVRKALLPGTAALVAPVAAYSVASKLALFQTTMDTAMATNVAFAGLLSYMGFTACIGVVALSTANDQMERVTWAPGMPLRDRWLREEERAAIDRIAVSWGFRESWRRGEEEGGDWDTLREWIGRKGMILDRVELMEGME